MACTSGPGLREITPPETDVAGPTGPAEPVAADVSRLQIATLKKRADFLRASKARRVGCPAFMVQAHPQGAGSSVDAPAARVGFTCSKKVGNAVARNRAKRRLRAMARQVLPLHARAGWDYVLVGRPGATATHDFTSMCADLERALEKLHGGAT